MEKNRLKRYKPSTGDRSWYYRKTTAVNDLAAYNSSAALGNLADVMETWPSYIPQLLAPDSFQHFPLERTEITESQEIG